MFGMFYNGPLTRKQYWLDLVALWVSFVVISVIIQFVLHGREDQLVSFVFDAAFLVAHLRLVYLRACDVGYEKPGWMTASCALPLAGIFIWLTITTMPTGSRIGCVLPCLPSTQKRWAEEAQARGMRLA
jgi:hypothetical protein